MIARLRDRAETRAGRLDGPRALVCRHMRRIAARRIDWARRTEHGRQRRPGTPEAILRRLRSLDYVIEYPHAAWLATEDERPP